MKTLNQPLPINLIHIRKAYSKKQQHTVCTTSALLHAVAVNNRTSFRIVRQGHMRRGHATHY